MLFTFKRDDEGRETIEVGGVPIARIKRNDDGTHYSHGLAHVPGIEAEHVSEAIERADAAGFWQLHKVPAVLIDANEQRHIGTAWTRYGVEVTVDVPVSETTVLSVTLEGEDQS